MKCIILAAGASTRMRPLTDSKPKCLLPVGGKPILQWIIENVAACACDSIGIVLGYRAQDVRAFVKKHFPFHRIRFLMNPKFESTNNAFSLLMGREFYLGDRQGTAPPHELLLLDSDIVFSPGLLPYFLAQASANRVAVRVAGEHDEEEIRVKIDEWGNVVMIGKVTPLSETYGESIGIELFSPSTGALLFEVLEARVRTGGGRSEFYEASFQELIDRGMKIAAVDTSDFPAVEIDTPEDLAHAEMFVAPLLGS